MIKTVYAIAVAAIAAACFVAFPSLSPQVEASSPVPGAKADRADLRPLGTECGQKAWPYFDAACLRDARYPLVQPHDVRFVSADRIAASIGAKPSRSAGSDLTRFAVSLRRKVLSPPSAEILFAA